MSKIEKGKYTAEAVAGFTHRTALEEAARCLLCHDAPCSKGCPAGTDPAKFIRSIRFRNVKGAAETIRSANVLGGSCARVCPYDNLCEEAYCSKIHSDNWYFAASHCMGNMEHRSVSTHYNDRVIVISLLSDLF